MRPQLSLRPMFLLAAAMMALPASAFAQAAPPDAKQEWHAEVRETSTFEVVAVDPTTRSVTLRNEDGESETYAVDKDVRNLEQVRPGDRVKVESSVETAIRVLPPGEMVNDDVETVDRAQPGEKPGGVAARTRTRTERIASVFPRTKEVVTRNAKGRLTTWNVRDAKQLENVKSGDRVQITKTSALAISVTAAPPATGPTTASATTRPTPATAPAPAAAAPKPAPGP